MTDRGRGNLRAAALAVALLGGALVALVAADLPSGLVAFDDPWLVEGRLGLGPSPPDPDALSVTSTRGEARRPLFWLALDLLREETSDPARAAHTAARALQALTAVALALAAAGFARRAGCDAARALVAGAAAAALWVLHPAHVAAVSSVGSLGLVLGTFLVAGAAALWTLAPERTAPRVAAALLLAAAALAEPALGVAAFGLAAAAGWLSRSGAAPARGTRAAVWVAAVAGVAAMVATFAVRESAPASAPAVGWAAALVRPLREFAWPVGLVPSPSQPPGFPDTLAPALWVDVATAAALLVAAFVGSRRSDGWGAALAATLVVAGASACLARPYAGREPSSYAASLPLAVAAAVGAARLGPRAGAALLGGAVATGSAFAVLSDRERQA